MPYCPDCKKKTRSIPTLASHMALSMDDKHKETETIEQAMKKILRPEIIDPEPEIEAADPREIKVER